MTFWSSYAMMLLLLLTSLPQALVAMRPTQLAGSPEGSLYLGSEYGGWSYLPHLVKKESVVYSVGLGEDVSWDQELIEKHGCMVFGFDPTPKSSVFVEAQLNDGKLQKDKFFYTGEGIAVDKGHISFALPENPDYVSMRAGAGDLGGGTVDLPVNSVENWMHANGHETLDILKLDVEGSEYPLLESWISRGFFPVRQLLVEFHHRFLSDEEKHRHEEVLSGLKNAGFAVVADHDGQEISFLNAHKDLKTLSEYVADGKAKIDEF